MQITPNHGYYGDENFSTLVQYGPSVKVLLHLKLTLRRLIDHILMILDEDGLEAH